MHITTYKFMFSFIKFHAYHCMSQTLFLILNDSIAMKFKKINITIAFIVCITKVCK